MPISLLGSIITYTNLFLVSFLFSSFGIPYLIFIHFLLTFSSKNNYLTDSNPLGVNCNFSASESYCKNQAAKDREPDENYLAILNTNYLSFIFF